MEFQQLIEVREKFLNQEFQNYACRRILISNYIIAGRKYFNNFTLNYDAIEKLVKEKLNNKVKSKINSG